MIKPKADRGDSRIRAGCVDGGGGAVAPRRRAAAVAA
eukprot:SAG25_NODE_794_length_5286_cov_3.737420_1_plen_36_part_10